jgi:hypothetical protein
MLSRPRLLVRSAGTAPPASAPFSRRRVTGAQRGRMLAALLLVLAALAGPAAARRPEPAYRPEIVRRPTAAAEPAIQTVDVIGLMHSGTNLVYALLQANFYVPLRTGLYADWKHNIPDETCLDEAPVSPTTLVISLVRDPAVQLERMYGESYEYKCGRTAGQP